MMIYLIKYIILSLLILFSSVSAMVSIDQARIVANNFLQEKQNTHTIKDIFLDKKRIGKYPRIIEILKFGKPKIVEMKDNHRIKKTISEVIF